MPARGSVAAALWCASRPLRMGARPISSGRMHHPPCRFVQYHQLRIFEHDVQRHGLGPKRLALHRRHQFDHDELARQHLARCRARISIVDPHMPTLDERLQMAARELRRHTDQGLIEPYAMQCVCHTGFAPFRHLAPWRLGGFAFGRSDQFIDRHIVGANPIIRAHFSTGRRASKRAISSVNFAPVQGDSECVSL